MNETKIAAKDVADLWSQLKNNISLNINEQELCIAMITAGYTLGFRRASGIEDPFAAGPLSNNQES